LPAPEKKGDTELAFGVGQWGCSKMPQMFRSETIRSGDETATNKLPLARRVSIESSQKELGPRLLRKELFDLSQVVDVVAGGEPGDGLNRFFTALRMHTMIFPLGGRQRFQ